MPSNESVSEWIADAKVGADHAANHLYHRYFERLLTYARPRINARNRVLANEEDIAQSVLYLFCQGVRVGRFEYVHNRIDLWGLLIRITSNKIIDYHRRFGQIASDRHEVRVSDLQEGNGCLNGSAKSDAVLDLNEPYMFARLQDQFGTLLRSLSSEENRRVALLRLEGNSIEEIAATISKSTRSVERKLRSIRIRWSEQLIDSHG